MRVRWLRTFTLLLCTAMIITAFAGCSSKDKGSTEPQGTTPAPTSAPTATAAPTPTIKVSPELNKTGMPVVNKPVTLKIMIGKYAAQTDWNKMLVWTEYEKLSGVHIEWIQVPDKDIVEKRNLAIASGDLPDAFFKCNIPAADLQSYGEQGIFVKLNDLINNFAPNAKKAIADRDDVSKGVKMVDGSIYSLPYIMDVLSPAITGKMFLNRKWVDTLGLKMPVTTDELYNVLTAIKKNDLNGNGKNDEIPLTGPKFDMILSTLRGAWGLGNRGNSNGFLDFDDKAGKVRYWPADPKYKEVLTYFNKLYKEGLLDNEIFQMDNTKLIAKAAQNQVGAFSAINNNAMGQKYQNDYEGIPQALKGPSGDQLWSPINSKIWDLGAFAITNKNKYPDITMRWVDYFYSEEGIKLYFMGIEGKTYKVTADGKYDYVDEINKNPNGLTYDQAIGQYLAWGSLGNPSMAVDKYFLGAAVLPIPLEAANRVKPYLPKEIWPQFSYTSQENEKKTQIETDLTSYVNEMTASFVTGKTPFTEWDNYVNKLKSMGLDDCIKICQAAYEIGPDVHHMLLLMTCGKPVTLLRSRPGYPSTGPLPGRVTRSCWPHSWRLPGGRSRRACRRAAKPCQT